MTATFQPRPAARSRGPAAAPTGLPQLPEFDLRAKVADWNLRKLEDGSHQWLPKLTKYTYRRGVQGAHFVEHDPGTGRKLSRSVLLNRDILRTQAARDGWITIPHDSPAGDYLCEYDTATGIGYCLPWESWLPAQPPFGPERVVDEAREVAYLRALVAAGIIPIPPAALHRQQVRLAANAVNQHANRAPSAKKDDDLAAAEAWLALVQSTPLPTLADFQPAAEATEKKGARRG